jgi:gas vesicle protein
MAEKNGGIDQSTVIAFLVGGLVGAGVALLVAPKSGKETRKQIKEFASRATDTVSSVLEKGMNLYERAGPWLPAAEGEKGLQ